MSLYSFSPEVRIHCAADYKDVFDGALFKVHQPHFIFLAKVTEQPKSRLGIVVAKKKVRRAHAGELVAESLRLAQNALAEITGDFSADDLLGVIFGSFCIGK